MKNQKYVDLLSGFPMTWLASRCATDENDPDFHYYYTFKIFYIENNIVDAATMYGNGTGFVPDVPWEGMIRPVVEIDLTKVNVGLTGTGADGDGYSLTLK